MLNKELLLCQDNPSYATVTFMRDRQYSVFVKYVNGDTIIKEQLWCYFKGNITAVDTDYAVTLEAGYYFCKGNTIPTMKLAYVVDSILDIRFNPGVVPDVGNAMRMYIDVQHGGIFYDILGMPIPMILT